MLGYRLVLFPSHQNNMSSTIPLHRPQPINTLHRETNKFTYVFSHITSEFDVNIGCGVLLYIIVENSNTLRYKLAKTDCFL